MIIMCGAISEFAASLTVVNAQKHGLVFSAQVIVYNHSLQTLGTREKEKPPLYLH